MPTCVQKVTAFKTTVEDKVGALAEVSSAAASEGINFRAFTGYPIGKGRAELIGIPEDPEKVKSLLPMSDMAVATSEALYITGDDKVGTMAGIAGKLSAAGINIRASVGMAVEGKFAFWLHLAPEDVDKAADLLATDCCGDCSKCP